MASGRRLRDGQLVSPTRPHGALALAALLLAAAASCPSHDSFTAHLAASAAHPSAFSASLARLAEQLRISAAADSTPALLFRLGSFRGHRYLGVLGVWVRLPAFAADFAAAACGGAPHETFVLLCCASLALWGVAPRAMARHTVASWDALRAGRVWTVFVANVSHASPLHLLHNALHILHFGPVLLHALGCERMLLLLLSACVAASAASIVWNAFLSGNPTGDMEGSLGASGVALALSGANAALFPQTVVRMYGVELSAAGVLLLYTCVDVCSRRAQDEAVDVSAHVGGALCGWLLGRQWRASLPFWL
ncbi:hypothetical protein AB1Y20_004657 [Prymnesium parvum]|uniref:Peptidase S54 rhomboid domain-containing protein n=1 Tax=Prymnesium parvum TaxID=97485 RepID=A0AB34IZ02_PRYPA